MNYIQRRLFLMAKMCAEAPPVWSPPQIPLKQISNTDHVGDVARDMSEEDNVSLLGENNGTS